MSEKKEQDTLAQAKEVIEKDIIERQESCAKEVNELLKKYNCSMSVSPRIIIEGRQASIIIKANP